ncbi:MAG: BREX-2 system phosphatase PglZ [Polyangiaceae bacterium]|nr:BREX-2 system phosphatase PglZ [Polyangiaceae bacterium]
MISAPTLSRHDVTDQLEKLYQMDPSRQRHLVAFFGTGVEEAVNTVAAGQFMIVPVRSELELRERMPPLEDEDARVAFLVPWTSDIPIDLAGRFARSGRVLRVGAEARLFHLLGVTEIDDEVRKSPLSAYLLATVAPGFIKVPAGRLTAPVLWNAWLNAAWGVAIAGGLGLDALLGWAALDGKGSQFTAAMQQSAATGVRDALQTHLASQLGPAGPIVWKAWESGKGRTVLAYALLFQTLAPSEHAGVKMWIKLAPRAALGVTQEAEMPVIATALGGSADAAFRHIEHDSPNVARQIVREADALVEGSEVREMLFADRRLPSAWRARLDTLGAALGAVAADPSVGTVGRAADALKALESHTFYTDRDQTALISRADMAVRLAAWLAVRPDRDLSGAPTPYADAELLARWYAAEGGYVDWARKLARGSAADAFGSGAQAVVAAADTARDSLDHRFARALASWVEAGRPSTQVVPIDQAVRRIAVPFLEENESRQLLVLLLDGMAWAQAVEILQSLGQRTTPWGPLAWHGTTRGRIGQGIYPAVLANLPTVTEVSRAAFFSGKAAAPGTTTTTDKDVTRWAENRDVAKLVPDNTVPKLLLRAEGHTQGGAASPEALSLVSDKSRRIVAIVINAIDASLKSDAQQRHAWTVESIQSLPELLERARDTGRAVLLASDHGHVPADRFTSCGTYEKAGARWRPWTSADEPLGPHEIGFRGQTVWSPRGAHGVVLLMDDACRYGGAAHAGEHGGATLAEVVAPCLLIGCEELGGGAEDDRGLDVRAAYVPAWWHFDVRPPVAQVEESDTAPKPKKAVNPNQLQLPTLGPPPSPFRDSAVLSSVVKQPIERKQIIEAVEFLLDRNGVASDAAFAASLNVPSWRVGGVVAKLAERLNIDGYQVIRYDPATKTIHLDREKLAQQFEVDL